jgi:transcription elongation factor Elf1
MGRRKRKQQSYKRVKTVPKIFTCPNCGEKSIKVENLRKSVIATVKCGHCGLTKEVLKCYSYSEMWSLRFNKGSSG